MVKVYPLKSRDEVDSAFRLYKNFVENQCDRKIKCVRTDNAPEYVSGEFGKIILYCILSPTEWDIREI